jgi:hypothetical protein
MLVEGRSLSSRRAKDVVRKGRLGNLATPLSVQKLQTALHAKAKDEPGCRFQALYDKVFREDVLRHAYRCCCANHGAPGVDGVRFEDIEAGGVEPWLGELAKTQGEDVSSGCDPQGTYPEAQRQVAASGDSDDPGSSSADGDGVGVGADL